MTNSPHTPGIVANRLPPAAVAENFAGYAPPLDRHEALVAADRCYFCHDAPCITACPTAIDIPLFIRQIATGTPDAAAKTIFAQNILGGMCARVCPTETLCEEACVRELAEGKPVEIGRLQRYAVDAVMARPVSALFARAATTGKRVDKPARAKRLIFIDINGQGALFGIRKLRFNHAGERVDVLSDHFADTHGGLLVSLRIQCKIDNF